MEVRTPSSTKSTTKKEEPEGTKKDCDITISLSLKSIPTVPSPPQII